MPARNASPGTGEFHQITSSKTEDVTDVWCAEPGCGFCEGAGTGCRHAVTHAADHTLVTGHTVIERHVTVSVFRECA